MISRIGTFLGKLGRGCRKILSLVKVTRVSNPERIKTVETREARMENQGT